MSDVWLDMAHDAGARGDEQRQMAAQIEEEERRKQEERDIETALADDQSDSLADLRREPEVDVLRRIEDAAEDLDQMFGGGPGKWRLDGRRVTEEAAGALLILHDRLNDVRAWREPR